MIDKIENENRTTKAQKLEAYIALAPPVNDEITYSNTLFVQCFLPVNKPKSNSWVVRHGKVGISIDAGRGVDLERLQVPYGSYSRLILAYVNNQIVRAGSIGSACQIDLGESMRRFFRDNDIDYGGKQGKSLKDQLMNLSRARITFSFFRKSQKKVVDIPTIATTINFWLDQNEDQKMIWQPEMLVNREYAELIRKRSMPLDLRARLGLMKDSPRGAARAMDVYDWLTYRLPRVKDRTGVFIPFEGTNGLHKIFGLEIKASKDFKKQFLTSLKLALKYYPDAVVSPEKKGLRLFVSPPAVPYGSSKPIYLSKNKL